MTDKTLKPENFAYIIESHSFTWVRDFLRDLREKDPEMYSLFWYMIGEAQILNEISYHKVLLGKFLSERAKVNALPEDRTRIVLLLANYARSSFEEVNQVFTKEFGIFPIYSKYDLGNGSVKTWQEIAYRAKQIENGLRNYFHCAAIPRVKEVLSVYKTNQEVGYDSLQKLYVQASEIIGQCGDKIDQNPNDPNHNNLKQEIIDFYHQTQRLELDVKKIDEETNYGKIITYVSNLRLVYLSKIYLINRKLPLGNLEVVENFLIELLGKILYSGSFSTEEIGRYGIKLQLGQPPSV